MSIKYRKDIDGLRAIAVILVIITHAFPTYLKSGFIGVDIFFVISGFLITSIILSDILNDNFSIKTFYVKRIRRIFPALITVLFFVLIFGFFYLLSDEYKSLGKHVLFSSAFASNFLSLTEVGYFEREAAMKPLLHLWSLAIEEQFYILWPMLLVLSVIKKLNFITILLLLILASLVLSIVISNENISRAYFLPWTRFWELLFGASIAIVSIYFKENVNYINLKLTSFFNFIFYRSGNGTPYVLNNVLSFVGFSVLIISLIVITEKSIFPGYIALLPVISAVLLIVAGENAILNKNLLGSKVLVSIGLISFPLYLWHWPLITFYRLLSVKGTTNNGMILIVGLSFLLSYVTYYFVEKPMRYHLGKVASLIILLGGIIVLAILGAYVYKTEGLGFRKVSASMTFSEYVKLVAPEQGLYSKCDTPKSLNEKKCESANNPTALLWGDSFAKHIAMALLNSAGYIPFRQYAQNGCMPAIGIANSTLPKNSKKSAERCVDFNQQALNWLQKNQNIEYVIMSSVFYIYSDLYIGGHVVGNNSQKQYSYIKKTVSELRKLGLKPIIIAPPPRPVYNLGTCWLRMNLLNTVDKCDYNETEFVRASKASLAMLRKLESEVPILYLEKYICSDKNCIADINGFPLWTDGKGHFTHDGSIQLGIENDLMGKIIKMADSFWAEKHK